MCFARLGLIANHFPCFAPPGLLRNGSLAVRTAAATGLLQFAAEDMLEDYDAVIAQMPLWAREKTEASVQERLNNAADIGRRMLAFRNTWGGPGRRAPMRGG